MDQTEPRIAIIAAISENGVIGRDGRMPWRLPSELAYFRARTLGKPVIMGRKTFQSLPKALPRRTNIVISRDPHFLAPGATVATSLDDAIVLAREIARAAGADEIMIIGGGEVYRQALAITDRIYLTRVAVTIAGDVGFPHLEPFAWRLVSAKPLEQPASETPRATTLVLERSNPEE